MTLNIHTHLLIDNMYVAIYTVLQELPISYSYKLKVTWLSRYTYILDSEYKIICVDAVDLFQLPIRCTFEHWYIMQPC